MRDILIASVSTFMLIFYLRGLTLVSASLTLVFLLTIYSLSRLRRATLESIKYPILALNFLSAPVLILFPFWQKESVLKFVEFLSVCSPIALISSWEMGRKEGVRELIPLILVYGSSLLNLSLIGSYQLFFLILFASFVYFFISSKTLFSLSAMFFTALMLYFLRIKGIETRVQDMDFFFSSKAVILTLSLLYLTISFLLFVLDKRGDILKNFSLLVSLILFIDLFSLFILSFAGGLFIRPYTIFGLLSLSTAFLIKGGMETR